MANAAFARFAAARRLETAPVAFETAARPIAERQGNAGRRPPNVGRLFRSDAPVAAHHLFPQAVHRAFKVRYATVEARYMAFETRYITFETRYITFETRYFIFDTRHIAFETRHVAFETRHVAFETRYITFNARHALAKVPHPVANLLNVLAKPRKQADHQPRQGDPDGQNRYEKRCDFRSHADTLPDGLPPRNRSGPRAQGDSMKRW